MPDRSSAATRPESAALRAARNIWVEWILEYRLPLAALIVLLVGGIAWFWPFFPGAAPTIWFVGLIFTSIPVIVHTAKGMLRGRFAADIVATLAISTSLILQEPLPGLIVVLMQTGGEALERYAEGRASAAVRALEEDAPRVAHRIHPDRIEDILVGSVAVGDTLLVRPVELLPCDGEVVAGRSHVDASRITGEPIPVSAAPGVSLLSGSLNGEAPLTVRATRISSESQYARIVELVRKAQSSRAPIQRLADRFAIWFTPLTLAVAAIAFVLSGSPTRILAVLVVATPCPLILATPVAIIGGINSAARRQIVVRTGTALEQLGKAKIGVFDKTGTLTVGLPEVDRIEGAQGFTSQEVLRLAAAVEQNSGHLLARTVVKAALADEVVLPQAEEVQEAAGQGVRGRVEGRRIAVGNRRFVQEQMPQASASAPEIAPAAAELVSYIVIDGQFAGIIEYADRLRTGLTDFFQKLRMLGIERTVLLSGDHAVHVQQIAAAAGIAEASAELLPEDKVRAIEKLNAEGAVTLMVGDGINDAPALSTATVGIALAGHGGGIAAESADIVILIDELDRVLDAVRISQSALRIAHRASGWGLA